MACYLVRVMKRSIAASERQFAEALVFAFPGRCYAGAHAIGSPYPHYVWEGYPKQRTASIFIVDGMNVRDSRVHNYPPRWNAAPEWRFTQSPVTRKGFGRPCHNATALYSSACYWPPRLLRPQLTQYAEVLRTYVNTSTIVCRPTKMMLSG